jgi:hypothetical protein
MQDTGMPWVLQPGYRLVTSLVIAILMFMLSKFRLPSTGARIVLAWDTGVAGCHDVANRAPQLELWQQVVNVPTGKLS